MQSAALRKNSSFSYSHCIYFQQSLHNFLSTLSFSMRFFILLFLFCFSLTYSVSLAIILCLFHFETSNLLLSQIFIALCCLCSFCTTDPILLQLIFQKQKTKKNTFTAITFMETQPNTNDEQQKMKTKNPSSPSLAFVDAKYRNFSSTRFLLILDFHRVSAIQPQRKIFKVLYRCNYTCIL